MGDRSENDSGMRVLNPNTYSDFIIFYVFEQFAPSWQNGGTDAVCCGPKCWHSDKLLLLLGDRLLEVYQPLYLSRTCSLC